MIITINGTDDFRIHERVAFLRDGFIAKYDKLGTNVQRLYGKTATPDDIRSNLLTQGLFSKKRFTVIWNVLELSTAAAQTMQDTLQQINEDSVVVAIIGELPKSQSELVQRLLQADRVEEYAQLSDRELLQWVQQRCKQADVAIDTNALTFLVQATGNELWTLHHVINQLTHYTKSITQHDVELFVASPIDDNIFHFTDALSEKNTKLALQLLHDQLDSGGNPFYILTMLARQLMILIELKETNGQDSQLHPYVIKKALRHAQRFSLNELRSLHQALTQIDITLKSSSQDPVVLLDKFVVTATL